jgi:tetratricopeptide (TPR) repeat protein
LQAAVAAGIEDPDVLAGLATALLASAPNQALTHAERVLAVEDVSVHDHIDALWVISQVQLQRRRLPEAAAALEQLTRLRRQGGDWYQWAACLHALGRYDEAIQPAERAVEIRPEVPIYRELLAAIYAEVNRAEDARREESIASELSQAMQVEVE